MPSGDAQRTWFPEMVARLRSNWHDGMSMPDLISLRDELDGMLQWIRSSRNFRTPIITCRRCGMTARATAPHVSVRALILALPRFEIASKDAARALETEWARVPSASPTDGRGKSRGRNAGNLSTLKVKTRVFRSRLAGRVTHLSWGGAWTHPSPGLTMTGHVEGRGE